MDNFALCPMCGRQAQWIGGESFTCSQGCRPNGGNSFASRISAQAQRLEREKYFSFAESEARGEDRNPPRSGGSGW